MNITPTFRKFHLQRHEDSSGVSGVGRVAEGIVFSDGMAVVRWLSACGSTNIYNNWEAVMQVHGHGGNTEIVFDDPAPGETNVSTALPDDAKEVLDNEDSRKRILAVAEEVIKIAEESMAEESSNKAVKTKKTRKRKKKDEE